ncbi:MAG: MATE family efflux transporter [Oscillospiraceae bacterium]|nr:MATE family efflux transporter [Oscillospiraceae bacterium]
MALSVALPIMIQNGITQIVGLLDNIMVGSVDTVQMTGVAISNQIMFVFFLAIFGAVSGAGIYGAQFYGQGDQEGVRNAFRYKLLICGALLFLGCGIFLGFGEELIRLYLKGEGDIENIEASLFYAKEYLYIIMIGLPPYVLAQCYAGTLRECGKTVLPMVAGIVSVFVNLIFNGILIFGLLGFPAMGAAGAAVATVISRFVEAGIVVIYTHRHREEHPFFTGVYRTLRMPKKLFGQITGKTMPLLLNETMWAGGVAMLAQRYSLMHYNVVPAYNIADTVSRVFNVAFLAMGTAIGIIVGQLLGANRLEEAKDTDRKLITFSVLMCFGIGGIMAIFAPLIPNVYDTTETVRELAKDFLLIFALVMPINSLANACYFTMRSGGKTFITFLFDSVYVWVVLIPMAVLLQEFTALTIVPLFFICQFADIGKGIIGLILLRRGVWIQNIVKEESV